MITGKNDSEVAMLLLLRVTQEATTQKYKEGGESIAGNTPTSLE